jgi:arylsulfatase A-like enzyme
LSRNNLPGAEIIRATPFGNHLTRQLAIAAIQNEQLGQGAQTDFLTISFSSTDYVGHLFGPSSLEVEDTYIQLDQDIDSILSYLDTQFGKENVLVFLTADHGASDVPGYLQSLGLPGGVIKTKPIIDSLKSYLQQKLGTGDWIVSYENQQIYLNRALIANKGLEARFVSATINNYFESHLFEGLVRVVDLRNQGLDNLPQELRDKISLGNFPNRSGDLVLIFRPNWIENMEKGTSHGAPYSYDTHVPLVWWGYHIPASVNTMQTSICDIAPTLAVHLRCPMPSAVIGKPILFRERIKQGERGHRRKQRK